MTIKEDLERVREYGQDEYYKAIQAVPSYQAEVSRVQTDFKGRSWIESPFKLPKFTDKEFEDRRVKYQAKYESSIKIPIANQIIHLTLPVKITAERMAAHNFAIKRGLPSPLNSEELQALQGRKRRFLNALGAPTPEWLRQAGAVSTFLDNAEDALVTAVVLGRLAVKAAPRLLGPLLPKLGWVLLGSDILNTANLIGQITWAAKGKKRIMEDITHGNPFHAKAAASRALKLKRTWPGFGEILEILQTTDQMFGVGLCLGPILGVVQDAMAYDIQKRYQFGINIIGAIRYPNEREKFFTDVLRYGPIVGTSSWMMQPEEYFRMMLTFNSALSEVWNWWVENDPLSKITGLQNIKLKPPTTESPLNIQVGGELGINIKPSPLWPIINKPEATLAEIISTYASSVVDSFRIMAFSFPTSMIAYMAGEQVVTYTKKILAAASDDHQVRLSTTAYASAAKDMTRDMLQIPPDTPQTMIDALADWIGDYERKTAGSPSTKEIEQRGRLIGIKWDRSFPRITFAKAGELFPEWVEIQNKLNQLFVAD